MSPYIFSIVWALLFVVIANTMDIYHRETVLGVRKTRVTWVFALIGFFPLIWIAATRTNVYGDTGMYMNSFQNMPMSFKGIFDYLTTNFSKDHGFYFLVFLIKMVVRDSTVRYFFVLASIQGICWISVVRKYSYRYGLALFLFVASTDYMSWMHNGIRQYTAACIIFAATSLLVKKQYVPLIGVILFASTLHRSALIMLPIIFIIQGKPWNWKTWMVILSGILAIVFVDNFTELLNDALTDTQYTNVVSDWISFDDNGTNPLRALVYSTPTIISLFGLKQIKEEDDPIINIACNMGIMSTALYWLSVVTSGIFIGRLPIYCSLYSMYILLPWEIDHIFNRETSNIIVTIMIILFLVFYYVQMHFTWSLM